MVLNREQFKGEPLYQEGQQTLFRTDKHGPANVYRSHATGMNLPDKDRTVDTYHRERGEFYDFNYAPGSREATWANNIIPHNNAVKTRFDPSSESRALGYDAYPSIKQAVPDEYESLRWSRPHRSAGAYDHPDEKTITVETREGSPVGKVSYMPTLLGNDVENMSQGTLVKTAEISPLFQKRGFSAKAIPDFLENHAEYGPIVVDGYTDAGAAAFGKKGIANEVYVDDPEGYEAEQHKRFGKKKSRNLGQQFEQLSLDV